MQHARVRAPRAAYSRECYHERVGSTLPVAAQFVYFRRATNRFRLPTVYSLTAGAGTETDFPSGVRTYLLNQLIM